ncbi:MAG: ABC transporter permease [Bacteroidetes bacterium]|nr:ABC transporter permease [Bacteroidota bacterium]MBM3424887.1 gliding motility-associated ABC transporter permease subunit GldF [Bacteroidota bacterium]
MFALYLKEVRSFLNSVVGYVFLTIFLMSCWLFNWMLDSSMNILDRGQADLSPFFNSAPYVFLILIPAITMRSIAEERRTGTIELLFTRPISDLGILLAKYFAGLTLLLLSVIPTLTYYISLYYLGKPVGNIDTGSTITSYMGLLLLGAAFVAIGIFSSALSSSQIVSFILAIAICYFFYDGLALLGTYAQFGNLDIFLQYLTLNYHYDSIKKGVIDASDIVFNVSFIILFLSASLFALKTLKK